MAAPTCVPLGNPGARVPDLVCNDSGCLAVRIDSRSGTADRSNTPTTFRRWSEDVLKPLLVS